MAADTEHGWRAVNAVELAGLRMPDDVALACAGEDAALFDLTTPSVTSMAQDTYAIGKVAGQTLARLMDGEAGLPPLTLIPPIGVVERASTDTYAYEDRVVAQAVRYIWDHVPDQITIEDLLERVHVSQSTLIRRFQKTLGKTPAEEIKRSRIETARKLLTTTDLPLAHVALDAGLGSQALMSRYIKQATGRTPLQLRRASAEGRA